MFFEGAVLKTEEILPYAVQVVSVTDTSEGLVDGQAGPRPAVPKGRLSKMSAPRWVIVPTRVRPGRRCCHISGRSFTLKGIFWCNRYAKSEAVLPDTLPGPYI